MIISEIKFQAKEISSHNLDLGIAYFESQLRKDSIFYNELVFIKIRRNRVKDYFSRGYIDSQEFFSEDGKITTAFLNLIDLIQTHDLRSMLSLSEQDEMTKEINSLREELERCLSK